MERQGAFDRISLLIRQFLGSETSWLYPESAEFSKSTIERYYGPCTDWTRADLILPCAKPVDEPPVQSVVSTPPVMIEDEQPVVITPRRDWYFDESDPPSWVIFMELRLYLERLLPHRPENDFNRTVGWELLGEVRL